MQTPRKGKYFFSIIYFALEEGEYFKSSLRSGPH